VRKEDVTPAGAIGVLRELRGARPGGTIVVDGAPALVPVLARELRAGAEAASSAAAVREGGRPDGASILVWVGEADETKLRAASRAHVPIVAVTESETVPYVLETDLVRLAPGQGFPVPEIAAAIARRARADGPGLAAQLPALRDAVVADLIATSSRRNALIAAAVFVPGADLPVLTLTQVRLIARIALAHGKELDRARGMELLGVVGAGFGFRALARTLLDFVPIGAFAVKSAVAYGGTRAVGEAARRYFAELG
jgi:uncharacterized protein (DUF697 family)